MELAIGLGIAALGYGIGSAFKKQPDEMDFQSEYQDYQGEEDGMSRDQDLAPPLTYGQSIQDSSTYPYDFKENVPSIAPEYEPDEIRAANDDLSDLPQGTAGVKTQNQPFFQNQPGTYNEPMLDTKLSVQTGTNNVAWNPKQELETMYEPVEVGHVNGAPVQLENPMAYYQGVINQTPKYNNVGPTDRLNVGPGLGLDADVPAANGFHDPTRILPADLGYKTNQFGGRVIVGRAQHDKPTQSKTMGIYRRDNIEMKTEGYQGIATHKAKTHHPQTERHTIQEDAHRNNLSKRGLPYNETGPMNRSSGNVLPGHLASGYEEILTDRDQANPFTGIAKGTDLPETIGESHVQERPHSDYMGVARGNDGIRGKKGTSVKNRQPYDQFRFDNDLAALQLQDNEVAIRPLSEIASM